MTSRIGYNRRFHGGRPYCRGDVCELIMTGDWGCQCKGKQAENVTDVKHVEVRFEVCDNYKYEERTTGFKCSADEKR